MKAILINKKEVAKLTLWAKFKLSEPVKFKPGQYFYITIPSLLDKDKRGNRRHFTILNSPVQNMAIEMTTRLTGSGFKETLAKMPKGGLVELGPITGEFVLPDDTSQNIVFLAGGIGITPFISMLRHIKKNKLMHKITLIYSNKDFASSAFLEEIQNLRNQRVSVVLTMTSDPDWAGEKRKIGSDLISAYVSDLKRTLFMIAGPPSFTKKMEQVLKNMNVDKRNIKSENFIGYD